MIKNLERAGKRRLTSAIGRVLRVRADAGPCPDFADLESILIVRQQNQLGDMILATPFFRAVRARAPHARLDVVTAPMNHAPLLHSERITEAIPYDKKHLLRHPAAARRFLERLRDAHYDLALVSSTVAFSRVRGDRGVSWRPCSGE